MRSLESLSLFIKLDCHSVAADAGVVVGAYDAYGDDEHRLHQDQSAERRCRSHLINSNVLDHKTNAVSVKRSIFTCILDITIDAGRLATVFARLLVLSHGEYLRIWFLVYFYHLLYFHWKA